MFPLDPKTAVLPEFSPAQEKFLDAFFESFPGHKEQFRSGLEKIFKSHYAVNIEDQRTLDRFICAWKIFASGALQGIGLCCDMARPHIPDTIVNIILESMLGPQAPKQQPPKYGLN